MSKNEAFERELKRYRPLEDTAKAREYLSRLCSGDKPSMCVPPEVDDWDMVFCRIISKCEELDKAHTHLAEMLESEEMVEVVRKAVEGAVEKANLKIWHRRKIDKTGFEVLITPDDELDVCGAGEVVAEFDTSDEAMHKVTDLWCEYYGTAALSAIKQKLTKGE